MFLKSQLNNDTIMHICSNHWLEDNRDQQLKYAFL